MCGIQNKRTARAHVSYVYLCTHFLRIISSVVVVVVRHHILFLSSFNWDKLRLILLILLSIFVPILKQRLEFSFIVFF